MIRMDTTKEAQEFNMVPRMSEQERMRFAAMVKPARLALGLTQAEVAEAAGVARNTVAHLEAGKQIPQAEKLWAIMLVVGVRPDSKEQPEWLDEWLAILIPALHRLAPEDRGRVLGECVRIAYEGITA